MQVRVEACSPCGVSPTPHGRARGEGQVTPSGPQRSASVWKAVVGSPRKIESHCLKPVLWSSASKKEQLQWQTQALGGPQNSQSRVLCPAESQLAHILPRASA